MYNYVEHFTIMLVTLFMYNNKTMIVTLHVQHVQCMLRRFIVYAFDLQIARIEWAESQV